MYQAGGDGGSNLHVQSEKVDVSVLREQMVFPFSGRFAPNRFLKAPKTERLCPWPENHAKDNGVLPNHQNMQEY